MQDGKGLPILQDNFFLMSSLANDEAKAENERCQVEFSTPLSSGSSILVCKYIVPSEFPPKTCRNRVPPTAHNG